MDVPDRFVSLAAERSPCLPAPAWRRHEDPETGLSFEVPFGLAADVPDGAFGMIVHGAATLPFVFDVAYMATREASDASPKNLTHEMATQWMVDYPLATAPQMRRVEYPGVDEAWSVSAEIEADAGTTIGYAWVTVRKGDRIGCLSVSCWSAEISGREAADRTLGSILGR